MLKTYDTQTQSSHEQFEYWREELCRNFVAMSPERLKKCTSPTQFSGRILQQGLDAITVSRVTAEAHCVNRTAHEISRMPEECFFANLQLGGHGLTRQGGVEIVSKPGDLVLVNACQPYSISHDEPFDLISVKVPHRLLVCRSEFKRAPSVPHITAERGYGTVLRSYVRSIIEELDTEFIESASFLADNLVSLIAAAINSAETSSGADKLGHQQYLRLQAILGYIKLNLSDPTLDLRSVSDHFNLSPRYVQKLFAAKGATFSQTVLNWRLDSVAADLRGPRAVRVTLAEVAFAAGFNDMSYFSRSFKKRFRKTAREYRLGL